MAVSNLVKVKNILSLPKLGLNKFLDSIDNIVLDADGVLWNLQSKPIDGVSATVKKLHLQHKNIYVVSNNTVVGTKNLHKHLQQLVPNFPLENVINPTVGIISYLKIINFKKEVVLVGSPRMREEFIEAGFKLASTGPDILDESIQTLMKEIGDVGNVGAAIFDADFNTNYYKLSKFLNSVQNEDVLFITGASENHAVIEGTMLIGPGHLQNMFAQIINRPPMAFGKPHEGMRNHLLNKLNNADPSRTLIIGDTLYQDVKFGKDCGFRTLLVLTGCTKLDDLKNCNSEETPDFYIPSLGDLSDYI